MNAFALTWESRCKVGKDCLAGFSLSSCQRETMGPAKHYGMTKSVDHVGHYKGAGVQIDVPPQTSRMRTKGGPKSFMKPDSEVDRAIRAMWYF